MAPSTNQAAPKGWAIGIAESSDLTQWKNVGEILPAQPCEQNDLVNGKALRLGGKLWLIYDTSDPSMQTQMLVAATAGLKSDFGRDARTAVGDGPILKPEFPKETRCIEAPSEVGVEP